jgi:hypothetical protein
VLQVKKFAEPALSADPEKSDTMGEKRVQT